MYLTITRLNGNARYFRKFTGIRFEKWICILCEPLTAFILRQGVAKVITDQPTKFKKKTVC